MGVSFKKDRFLFFFFGFLGAVLLLLLTVLIITWKIEKEETLSSQKAYTALAISSELRQSSDDLTKMVRLYVLTGDKKYLKWYEEILSIRNGTSPRPLNYDAIYWDFVLEDDKRPRGYEKAISFTQIMKEQGFAPEEFALLEKARLASKELTQIEKEAIEVMDGRFDNGSGDFSIIGKKDPELARELVSNQAYMREKAKIMFPLAEFNEHVKKRIAQRIQDLNQLAKRLIFFSSSLSILAFITMIICLAKSRKALLQAAQTNEELLLNLLPPSLAKRFQKGERAIVEHCEGSVLFVHIKRLEDSLSLDTLNTVFKELTSIADLYKVEVVKILGETCLIASGVPVPSSAHAVNLADFALALEKNINKFNEETGLDLTLRMGMASGSISFGIVEGKRFFYDLWGSVVSLASFLESFGDNGKIQVSEQTAKELKKDFILEEKATPEGIKSYFLLKRNL